VSSTGKSWHLLLIENVDYATRFSTNLAMSQKKATLDLIAERGQVDENKNGWRGMASNALKKA
jgi:hypothetical protein